MVLVKNILRSIVIMSFLFSAVFMTSCTISWFDDIEENSDSVKYTVYKFYSMPEEAEKNPVIITRMFKTDSFIPAAFFPNDEMAGLKPGYIFNGWNYYRKSLAKNDRNLPPYVIYENNVVSLVKTNIEYLDFAAAWIPDSSTKYYVHHFFENLEDEEYTENPTLLQELNGLTDSMSNAKGLDVEGFVPLEIEQQLIKSDNTTEIFVYYKRKIINVKINFKNGQSEPDHIFTGKYGSALPEFSVPEKQDLLLGYWKVKVASGNAGSVNEIPKQMPAEDSEYTAVWCDPNSVQYSIRHNFEDTDDNSYTLDETRTEIRYGVMGELSDAEKLDVPGFSCQPIEQKVIELNGSTVVDVYYKRNIVKINIDYGIDDIQSDVLEGKYGALVKNYKPPVRPGYKVIKWTNSDTKEIFDTFPETFPLNPLNLEAVWGDDDAAVISYYVYHSFEDENGSSFIDYSKSQYLMGYEGHLTEAKALEVEGFTPSDIEQKILKKGIVNSITVHYYRNEVTVSFDFDCDEMESISYVGKYGIYFWVSENYSRTGYEFIGWKDKKTEKVIEGEERSFRYPAEDTAYVAVWLKLTPYTVVIWRENIQDDEFNKEIRTEYGKAGDQTHNADILFWDNGYVVTSYEPKIIQEDGSTIVELYAKHKIVTMKIYINDGITEDPAYSFTGKTYTPLCDFGFVTPERPGYILSYWKLKDTRDVTMDSDLLTEMYAYDTTATAVWIPESDYYQTVCYEFNDVDMKKNVHWDNFIIDESKTEKITEKIDNYWEYAGTKQFDDYELYSYSKEQKQGAPEGIFTITIYYIRKEVNVLVFYNNKNSYAPDFKCIQKADSKLEFTPSPKKAGAVLTGWLEIKSLNNYKILAKFPKECPDEDAAYYAVWDNNPQVIFDVTYYVEDMDDISKIDYEHSGKRYVDFNPEDFESAIKMDLKGYYYNKSSESYNSREGIISVTYWYYRNNVSVHIYFENGELDKYFYGKFGDEIETVSQPENGDYKFGGWKKVYYVDSEQKIEIVASIPRTFEEYTTIYTAIWNQEPIGVVVKFPVYVDKNINLSAIAGSGKKIYASVDSGYYSYCWFFNGQPLSVDRSSNTCTIDFSGIAKPGVYEVMAVAIDNSMEEYSAVIEVLITSEALQ